MSTSYFQDSAFQDHLLALAVRDQQTLRTCGRLLTAKDFRPLQGASNGQQRWVVAQMAFDYYQKYREPVGDLLLAEVKSHCVKMGLSGKQAQVLIEYAESLLKRKLVGTASIIEKAVEYKKDRLKAQTIQRIIEEQQAGTLTDERWAELSRKALEVVHGNGLPISDYFNELDQRILRRSQQRNKYPLLLIEPLDDMIHTIARGEMGLVIAPYKRGKSLFLLWIALAYVIQRLNVLFITLEDPKEEVEDRLDMAVTGMSMPNLKKREYDPIVRKRFQSFRRLIRSKLSIVDGTQGTVSVRTIDDIIDQEREKGFLVDAVIVDYDDEILPPEKKEHRRFEFADIYANLRQLAARRHLFLWTAAQTQRNTEELRVISADKLAEDISKVRKVTMAISIGQGEWGEDSVYLHVAAHKTDKSQVGTNIYTRRDRGMFYDRFRTQRRLRSTAEETVEDEEAMAATA
jgi:replicative DNA helicase